ncbi:MAG TPA: short-chain dehydrogenase, partial [Pseudomonas sp.]|nr:short-chain dehydrogenase [Pseudomonas sp.]
MNTNFQGRLAVVTGASSGIGLAVCDLLLQRSARVLAFSRRLGALAALQASYPEQLHWCAGDVTDIDSLHALAERAGRLGAVE